MTNSRFAGALLLMILFFGCKKDGKDVSSVVNGTSWHATDFWQGIGSADDGWHHITGNSETLVFDDHGKGRVYSNAVLNRDYHYQVTGDSTMDVTGDSVSQTGHEYFYVRNDTLEIWGIGCTEGCGSRYVKNLTD